MLLINLNRQINVCETEMQFTNFIGQMQNFFWTNFSFSLLSAMKLNLFKLAFLTNVNFEEVSQVIKYCANLCKVKCKVRFIIFCFHTLNEDHEYYCGQTE